MGRRNYLVEGVPGSGKTAVCQELRRRGYTAVNGDNELAYQGDPETGVPTQHPTLEPTPERVHRQHLWRVEQVRALVSAPGDATFFCGGCRNLAVFVDLFDAVFVLQVDRATLQRRLDQRPEDEFGGRPAERELITRLHRTGEDSPEGILIDATAPLTSVVDEILRRTGAPAPTDRSASGTD